MHYTAGAAFVHLGPGCVACIRRGRPHRTGKEFATFRPIPTVQHSRQVERTVRGQPTSDGDGVKLTRVLTEPLQKRLDPFLMLDAFGRDAASDDIGGISDHPHRGFETVTIMLAGRMRHRDSVGNVGLLEPGSVQWKTAGRGIIHSEMPEQDAGRMAGFQLWVNPAAKDKMTAPEYRDIAPADVPVHDAAARVDSDRMAILTTDPRSDGVRLRAAAAPSVPARVLLVAGRPLGEPIAQYGPFVMNTAKELQQAFADFQRGALVG